MNTAGSSTLHRAVSLVKPCASVPGMRESLASVGGARGGSVGVTVMVSVVVVVVGMPPSSAGAVTVAVGAAVLLARDFP